MKATSKKVLVVLPEPLLKRLDIAARRQSRNRSAELCIRLADSLNEKKAAKAGATA